MEKLKIGDVVTRKSYNNDILFYIEELTTDADGNEIVILSGVNFRIIADAPLGDLIIASESRVKGILDNIESRINGNTRINNRSQVYYGKILHLDGDRRYSEKTSKYYRKRGLEAIVKYIEEPRQPLIVGKLLQQYKPNILVVTGHDSMIKKGKNYNDISNYRNSKYFIKAVIEARKWSQNSQNLAIFAGACQSFYEAIISAGANFASSPGRILIDFVDPLIVAEEIAFSPSSKIVTMSDFERKIRNGRLAIGGLGARGKKIVI